MLVFGELVIGSFGRMLEISVGGFSALGGSASGGENLLDKIKKDRQITDKTETEMKKVIESFYKNGTLPHALSEDIHDQLFGLHVPLFRKTSANARVTISAPLVRGRKGEFQKEFKKLLKDGYTRVRVDGELKELADERGSNISQIIRQACIEHLKKSGVTIKKSKPERR